MEFPRLEEDFRLARLKPPAGKVRMVLDTDTFNEIDDQFAVVYSLLSPEAVEVEAIYAAPSTGGRSPACTCWASEPPPLLKSPTA